MLEHNPSERPHASKVLKMSLEMNYKSSETQLFEQTLKHNFDKYFAN